MTAPGWYPDPSGNGGQRYWDGTNWTAVAAPAKRSNARLIAGISLGSVLLLMGGCFAIGSLMTDDRPNKPAPSKSTSAAATTRTKSTALPGDPIPPSPGEAYKIGGFGNKILPGIYQAPGASAGGMCSWVVQRDLVGDETSIVSQGSGAPGESVRVGLRDGQYFTSDGCGTWIRVGRIE